MNLVYIVLVILVGSAMALQGTVNSQLRAQWDVTAATLMSALVSVVSSLLIWGMAGAPVPPREKLLGISPWLLTGGLLASGAEVTAVHANGLCVVFCVILCAVFCAVLRVAS